MSNLLETVSETYCDFIVSLIIFNYFLKASLTEDFCGVEPVTLPPIEMETRPPPEIDEERLRKAYNQVDSAILGSKLSLI